MTTHACIAESDRVSCSLSIANGRVLCFALVHLLLQTQISLSLSLSLSLSFFCKLTLQQREVLKEQTAQPVEQHGEDARTQRCDMVRNQIAGIMVSTAKPGEKAARSG